MEGYYGLKRKRRFVCDQCDKGYLRSADGTCHHCSTLGFDNCKNCSNDTNDELICVECSEGYFVSNEGKCVTCENNQIKGNNNRCIECDDIEGGGIEGCESCSKIDNQIICHRCRQGFMLFENNNTCLKKYSINNIIGYGLDYCSQITLNNKNQFICSKCQEKYILLKESSYARCTRCEFVELFNDYNGYYCAEYINLGTEDQPLYSCSKCKQEYDYYDFYDRDYNVKISFKENNTAFCTSRYNYNSMGNCTEATMIIENGIEIFNCSKCIKDNNLTYHSDTNSYTCKYISYEKQCVIKYCRTCMRDNNYFCSECLPANFEVNPLTGGCIRKADKVPAVSFKDIFRLKLNQEKLIGGKTIRGPFLSIRGLTNSQINTGHTFLVYLTFLLQHDIDGRNRNLEEVKKVPTYCEVVESVDETNDEANIVDYDCIGNLEDNYDLSEYKLDKMEVNTEENEKVLGINNLNDLASKTDLENIGTKTKTNYELKEFAKLAIFSLNEIPTITSNDYKFDFTLKGKLNKVLEPRTIDAKIPLSQIKDKKVDCKFNIKENKEADLNCDLNLEEYNDYNNLSFKTTEIGSEENPIYLARINEVMLVHEDNKNKENKENKKNSLLKIIIIAIILIVVILIIIIIIISVVTRVIIRKKKKNIIQPIKSEQTVKYIGNINNDSESKNNIITNKKIKLKKKINK